jgi:GntR family transcriptional regulator/MocR family aminotransferase
LRKAILGGRLARGQRMPSSRTLAQALAISRTTVVLCYDQLVSEGYLESHRGSGTFVCGQLPEEFLAQGGGPGAAEPRQQVPVPWSEYGERLLAMDFPAAAPVPEAPFRFTQTHPPMDAFPVEVWKRLLARHCRNRGPALTDFRPESTGCESLRRAIAGYLQQSRAVRCTPDQVLVLGSSLQGVGLAARILVDPGDTVAMEDPAYLGARRTFLAQGARILALPAGPDGVSLLPLAGARNCKLVYVTPSHQFPTGTTMGLAQRLELLAWCRQNGAMLLEDDYDSEFRYVGRPLPATQGLDDQGTVLYVGTFSKALFPALRLGYLVAPPGQLQVLARAHQLGNGQPPLLEQYALADFILEGHLERHVRRMRTTYGRRREALLAALDLELGDRVAVLGEPAGMHLMVRFKTNLDDETVARRAAAQGVSLAPAGRCFMNPGPQAGFILSFVGIDEDRIRQGVRRLAQVLGASGPGDDGPSGSIL